ncbi:hypothetical protein AH06_114 [Erwinia phage AH06]|nr:hypothetical protein AH06_114 [Erwinia phage AH06]
MTLKSNKQLNAETPELRDLVIVIDGLNVLDLNLAPGARAARYSVQLSGDMGLTPNNKRAVYGHAAQLLNALLERGFSAHANVSRDDLDNDVARATELMQQAVNLLIETGEDVMVRCHSLSISVTTVDFNLTGVQVISDEAMDKVEFLLAQPAEPSEALAQLLGCKNQSCMINNELHVRREFANEYGDVIIVWMPIDLNQDILHTGDVDKTKLSFHGDASDGKPTFIINRYAVKGNTDQSPV